MIDFDLAFGLYQDARYQADFIREMRARYPVDTDYTFECIWEAFDASADYFCD